jgi:hypothetical protein
VKSKFSKGYADFWKNNSFFHQDWDNGFIRIQELALTMVLDGTVFRIRTKGTIWTTLMAFGYGCWFQKRACWFSWILGEPFFWTISTGFSWIKWTTWFLWMVELNFQGSRINDNGLMHPVGFVKNKDNWFSLDVNMVSKG